jgi:hypothetical protein
MPKVGKQVGKGILSKKLSHDLHDRIMLPESDR